MNIALLFDASNPSLEPDYATATLRIILNAGVLQAPQTHIRVAIGDILTQSLSAELSAPQIFEAVYSPTSFDRLRRTALQRAVAHSTIFCWLLQNMTREAADALDQQLDGTQGYLG